MVQAGGVKLEKLHVRDPGSCAVSQRNTVASSGIRIGSVQINLSCPSGSQQNGFTGEGDGTASAGLDPKPQNLAERQSELSDAYLFWRISDGGLIEPFNSLMPGWRGLLSEDQIWQVITYLRTF